MSKCIFCDISKGINIEEISKLENTIIYENDKIIVTPALGMSIPNYLMIFSKEHINGFAEFNESDLLDLENLINYISKKIETEFGLIPLVFEHGSLPEGRHPRSITHAHLHFIPIKLSKENELQLFSELKLKKMDNIKDLKKLHKKDYWVYRDANKNYFVSHSVNDAPRSCFIKIVAKEAGFDNSYEWRDKSNNRIEDVLITIETYDKLLNK